MTTTEYVDVSKALQNLEDEVCQENFEAVRDLINHAAAEGIGESQQQRHIYAWKTVLNKFAPEGFRIRGASEQELKNLVAALNRSDYAESTKNEAHLKSPQTMVRGASTLQQVQRSGRAVADEAGKPIQFEIV